LQVDPAVHRGHQLAHDVEAEADAFLTSRSLFDAAERLEQLIAFLGGDALAVVAYLQDEPVFLAPGNDNDLCPVERVLVGVLHEVPHYLGDAIGVDLRPQRLDEQLQQMSSSLPGSGVGRSLDRGLELDPLRLQLQPTSLDLGRDEEVLDEAIELATLRLHHLE
jgi:hypothetical protein